ncbi:hypothetical protein Q4S45_04585 [Massilia sp. R2A-15]|uniref:PspA/IM30 family protein n=1 Tax=Massilia sp. R2A-15 TaxID=3064278 RepID=UPI0027371377|nr:hypothetical protein [Massilia sp. R2A-15]WLI90404.1 hypothetical protein Q4S45_04585 [Massilia sp. R2A-15]
MNRNYFLTLFKCIVVSIVVLASSTFFRLPPWVAMLGGILPLVYYHLLFLWPQASKGLSGTAIDSVYYFGFLVTVSALGISAISIAFRGSEGNLNTVIYQFGVGLFATGYAVVARMHLTSSASMVDEASPEALMDRYVKRSVELVSNVEMASSQLAEFSKDIIRRTVEMTESTRSSSERMMMDAARAFDAEMKNTLASARDSLAEIRGLVSETSFVAEREELARSLKSTSEATSLLNAALTDLASKARVSAQSTQESVVATDGFQETVRTLAAQIDALGGDDGAFIKSAETLKEATASMSECNTTMSVAAEGLSQMVSTVSDTGPTFKQMRTLTKKATEQLEALAEASGRINTSLDQIASAAVASDSLAVGMSKVTSAMEPLASGSNILALRFTEITKISSEFDRSIGDLPARTALLHDTANEIAAGLQRIFEVIEVAATHSERLSENSVRTAKTVEGATKLLETADGLQKLIEHLHRDFHGFTNSLQLAQDAILTSSTGIKTAIHGSTLALEGDIKRSAEAASMFTERLSQVAQNIIDRTKPEPVR